MLHQKKSHRNSLQHHRTVYRIPASSVDSNDSIMSLTDIDAAFPIVQNEHFRDFLWRDEKRSSTLGTNWTQRILVIANKTMWIYSTNAKSWKDKSVNSLEEILEATNECMQIIPMDWVVYITRCGENEECLSIMWTELNNKSHNIFIKAENNFEKDFLNLEDLYSKHKEDALVKLQDADNRVHDILLECDHSLSQLSPGVTLKLEYVKKHCSNVCVYDRLQFVAGIPGHFSPELTFDCTESNQEKRMNLEETNFRIPYTLVIKHDIQGTQAPPESNDEYNLILALVMLTLLSLVNVEHLLIKMMCSVGSILVIYKIAPPLLQRKPIAEAPPTVHVTVELVSNTKPRLTPKQSTKTNIPSKLTSNRALKTEDIQDLLDALHCDEACLNGTASSPPKKWLIAASNDKDMAMSQWKACLQWRKENHIDEILRTENPYIEIVKANSLHSWTGHDNSENLVAVQKFGSIVEDIKNMKKENITPEIFAQSIVFLNEYWIQRYLSPTAQFVHVIDLKGFTIGMLSMSLMNFCKPMSYALQQYPDLLAHAYIVNAPSTFCFIWKMVSPFVAKQTLEKVEVIGTNKEQVRTALTRTIPKACLPVELGGEIENLRTTKYETQLSEFIKELNSRK